MNLFKAFAPQKKKELGLPVGVQWQMIKGLYIPYDNLDSVFIEKGFKAIPIIQSLVSKIAEKASDATPQVMRIKDKKAASKYYSSHKYAKSQQDFQKLAELRVKAFDQVDNHPFLDVMDNPNPIMSGRELREASFAYCLITGNAIEYAASPGSGERAKEPRELWSIPSPCVKPVLSGNRRDPIEGYAVTYAYNQTISKSNISHFKYFNPVGESQGYENSFWGFSPLGSSRNQISQKRYADLAQGNLFANMGPAGMISGNASKGTLAAPELTPDQAEAINDDFVQNHTGAHKAGSIIITPADVKWVQIGLSPVDMQILEFNKDLERQIANIYGYPSQLLNPDGTLANSDSGDVRVITNCVLPLLRKFDDIRTMKIREWYSDPSLVYMSDTDVYPELESDKKELVSWMRSAMVFTDSEIRNALGYEAEFDSSLVLVPSSMMRLSDVGLIPDTDLEMEENNL
jgi:HK97 family phage portal protein